MFWNIVLFHMIPANCPECNGEVIITGCPPSEHGYSGWITQIKCETCGFEEYEPELQQT